MWFLTMCGFHHPNGGDRKVTSTLVAAVGLVALPHIALAQRARAAALVLRTKSVWISVQRIAITAAAVHEWQRYRIGTPSISAGASWPMAAVVRGRGFRSTISRVFGDHALSSIPT